MSASEGFLLALEQSSGHDLARLAIPALDDIVLITHPDGLADAVAGGAFDRGDGSADR